MKIKKIWLRPQLKVLIKSESEENVLYVCKKGDAVFSGPVGGNYCFYSQNTNWISCKDQHSS